MLLAPERTEEIRIRAPDGLRLFARVAEPSGSATGTVIITHGMGEHSGRYPHVMAELAASGFRVVGYDLRGHGQSEGRRGGLARYELYLDDLQAVIAQCGTEPVFLYGHSMGAQVVINFLADRRPGVSGTVLTSPWLRLAFRPPVWKVALARLTAKIWPDFTQTAPHSPHHLSRDADWLKSLDQANLVHRRVSAVMYVNLSEGAKCALSSGPRLHQPVLLMHGEDDPVTCAMATRSFFDSIEAVDKTLRLWPEMRHELHNELGRYEVIKPIVEWLRARAGAH